MFSKKSIVFFISIIVLCSCTQTKELTTKQPRLQLYLGKDMFANYLQDTNKSIYGNKSFVNLFGYENYTYELTADSNNVVMNRIGLLLPAKTTTNNFLAGTVMFGNKIDTCKIIFRKETKTITHGRSAAISISNAVNTFTDPSKVSKQADPYDEIKYYKLAGFLLLHGDSSAFTFTYKSKNRIIREGELILHGDTLYINPVKTQINRNGNIVRISDWELFPGIILLKKEIPYAAIDYNNNPTIFFKVNGLSSDDDLKITSFLFTIFIL